MTNEEAIEIINRENDPNDKKVWELFPEYREALDMAIKALEQLKIKDMDRQYNAGVVCENNGNYIIGYEMQGAEETFSIGQPVYDKDKNIMGWLGIGLFENLNYSAKVRVPCEYWQICLPTKFCEVGKQVYTYWQMAEVEPQESENEK